MSRTIAIANQKGGVGKTTTAINLGAALAAGETRILLVDLDPQANASSGLGYPRGAVERSTYDVLCGSAELDEIIVSTELMHLALAPSSEDLAAAEIELVAAEGREMVLGRALERLGLARDAVLIDCPPSLGLLTLNALCAADSVLVPVQCEYYALEGLGRLIETIERIRASLNARLSLEGILLTMFDRRNNLSRQVAAEVRSYFDGQVFETMIPRNVRLGESPSFGKPIILYDIDCAGARSYLELADELRRRGVL